VQVLCREQGTEFPVSLKALFKHLRTDGILKGLPRDGTATRPKWVDGKNQRLLWIPKGELNGPQAALEQQKMNFTPVNDDDIPQEWRGKK
jgi:hypothetical protein